MKEEIKKEIRRWKEKEKAVILAHNYQLPEIQDIADFCGDSLELARRVKQEKDKKTVVFCGVYFMAETAKIINPEKRVLIPDKDAGCSLAQGLLISQLQKLKSEHPSAKVVCYVNSSAEVKALSDYCCTSANAVEVVKRIDLKYEVIFVPDVNLGRFVAWRLRRPLIFAASNCYVHHRFTLADVEKARRLYPQAKIVVHPEAPLAVIKASDYARSTSGMLKLAETESAPEFVIGTEISMLYRLRRQFPLKKFYALASQAICMGMKKISILNLLAALKEKKYEVNLPPELIKRAYLPIARMLG